MFQGLRTVVYPVGNLAEATAWYREVLGQAPYFEEPFYVGFNVGGYELGLVPDGTPAGPVGPTAYWGVPDAAAAYDPSWHWARSRMRLCRTWAAASCSAPCSTPSATCWA